MHVWLYGWHVAAFWKLNDQFLGSGKLDSVYRRALCVFLCLQLQPIHEMLRHTNLGPLEAKRQNLRRALDQYLMEFNACRCGPCFNKGLPILEGTSCTCQCSHDLQGLACEKTELKGKAHASSLMFKPGLAQRGQHRKGLWGS